MVHRRSHLSLLSLRARVWHPNTRIYVRLLGPCFKTGRLRPFRQHPKRWCGPRPRLSNNKPDQQAVQASASKGDRLPKKRCSPQSSPKQLAEGYNTRSEPHATFLRFFAVEPNWCWPARRRVHRTRTHGWSTASNTGIKRFPFDNFTYCLTLFSKFFSSFPHGTCSLSVSRQYLALDGIYHPFWSAFPNKPTLGKRITWNQITSQRRDFHPLWCLVPKNLY